MAGRLCFLRWSSSTRTLWIAPNVRLDQGPVSHMTPSLESQEWVIQTNPEIQNRDRAARQAPKLERALEGWEEGNQKILRRVPELAAILA